MIEFVVLKKINRISGRKEFLEVKNKGQLCGGFLFGSLSLVIDDENIKFGFIISKKISKRAVDRNKIKRKICEVLKNKINEFKPGTRIVFLAKKSLLEIKQEEIRKEIDKLISGQNPPPRQVGESSLNEGRKF
jgi:ribonuclease P protein component